MENACFVFCNSQRIKIKIIEWVYNGFWLYYKRLNSGRFAWPSCPERILPISRDQYDWLMNGLSINQRDERVIRRKNFLFAASVAGARASEAIYSIVKTTNAKNLQPYEYLNYVIEELSQNRQTPEKLDELLPWSDKLPEKVKKKLEQPQRDIWIPNLPGESRCL